MYPTIGEAGSVTAFHFTKRDVFVDYVQSISGASGMFGSSLAASVRILDLADSP